MTTSDEAIEVVRELCDAVGDDTLDRALALFA